MEILFKVFGGGNEVLDVNRFVSYLKLENIYVEVGQIVFMELFFKSVLYWGEGMVDYFII